MKKYLIILFTLVIGFTYAQDNGIIEGVVLDKELNNEPLAFASIKIKETKEDASTNIDGAYALELKPGIYTLVVNFPGYKKVEVSNINVRAGEVTSIEKIAIGTLQLPELSIATTSKEEK